MFEEVKEVVKNGVILAGGACRSLHDKTPVEDYDLFFIKDEEPKQKKIDRTISSLEQKGFSIVFQCPEGHLTTMKQDELKVQVISRFEYDSALACISTFDFLACCMAWDGMKFIELEGAINDAKNKALSLNKLEYPVATLRRMTKYLKKGYKPSRGLYAEIVRTINEMPLTDDTMLYSID